MEFTRWYDKDENLKIIMQTLENLDPETRLLIAADIIQMAVESKVPNTDNFIDDLNAEYIPIRRRWYDTSESLHSAIEMLKLISEEEKQEFLRELFYSILHFTKYNVKRESTDNENISGD